jgi:hypothetical protein
MSDYNSIGTQALIPTMRRINNATMYELVHARLGHPGTRVMTALHKHVEGIPKLTIPPLYRCGTCVLVNATKRAITHQEVTRIHTYTKNMEGAAHTENTENDTSADHTEAKHDDSAQPGQRFHMDMGFMRGTMYAQRDIDRNLVTSIDGYNSYLLIVDRATRYTWVFLARTKTPPISTITNFLKLHGTSSKIQKYIRTDKGGELWGSHAFQHTVRDAGYILESTAPDASFQNGMAERPNRTLGNMMCSLLHTASLGPEYWSWAIIHATYLKNRLPHRTTGMTPVQAYTGKKPNLTKIRIFGSPIVARLPGKRPAKLDTHATTVIFLGYTATENNIYYMDITTRKN